MDSASFMTSSSSATGDPTAGSLTDRRFSARSGMNLELQPGMTATAEIRTGTNTVLRYLLKPVLKTIGESFGER